MLAIALCEVVQLTFTGNKWNSYFANYHARVYEMMYGVNNLFSLNFL